MGEGSAVQVQGYGCPNEAFEAGRAALEGEATVEELREVAGRMRLTSCAGHGKAARLRERAALVEALASRREAAMEARARVLTLAEATAAVEAFQREAAELRAAKAAEEAYTLGVAFEHEPAEGLGVRAVSLPAGEFVGELAVAVYAHGRLIWVGEEAGQAGGERTYWQSGELAGAAVAAQCAELATIAANLAFPRERGVEVSERA